MLDIGIGWWMWNWLFRENVDNTSCFFFMTDAAFEKCKQSAFQMDMIISSAKTPSFNPPKKTWAAQYVEPNERIAF